MAKTHRQHRSRALVALLLSVPISFVFLESFSYFHHSAQDSAPMIQGHIPSHIQAYESTQLNLHSPSEKKWVFTLENIREQSQSFIPTQRNNNQVSVDLPGLSPGVYQYSWHTDSSQISEAKYLFVQKSSKQSWTLDRSEYYPGDRLFIQSLQPNINAKWRIYSPSGQTLLQGQIQDIQRQHKIKLPRTLKAGQYRLQIQNGQRVTTKTFRVLLSSAKNNKVRVAPLLHQKYKHQEQFKALWILAANGELMPSGWISVGPQTFPIRNGYAEIHIDKNSSEEIAYTVSDDAGNLSQGSLKLLSFEGPWLLNPRKSQDTRVWEFLAKQSETLFFEWKSDKGVQQSSWNAQPGEKWIAPTSANIKVFDTSGRSQILPGHEIPTPLKANLSPQSVHALQKQKISFDVPVSGQLYRYLNINQHFNQHVLPGPDNHSPTPPRNPQALLLWSLMALAFVSLPLVWFILFIRSLEKKKARPFPKPKLLSQLKTNSRTLQLASLAQMLSLGGLILSPGLGASLSILCLVLHWPLWQKQFKNYKAFTPSNLHHLVAVQSLQSIWAVWFSWSYAPLSLVATGFANSLVFLAWANYVHRLVPGRRPQDMRPSLLASLFVGILMYNGTWYFYPPDLYSKIQEKTSLKYSFPERGLLWNKNYDLNDTSILDLSPARNHGLYTIQVIDETGALQQLTSQIQAAPELKVFHPQYLVEDDLAQFKYEVKNPTDSDRLIQVEILGQSYEHPLTARGKRVQSLTQKFEIPGQRSLQARLAFQNEWFDWPNEIFVFPKRENKNLDSLELKWVVPIRDPMAIGAEIPVMVEFEHHFETARSLGIQLGIPAGFKVIQGNQKDFKTWLIKAEPALAYLNLTSKAIPPGERHYYQFRLRSQRAGVYHFPAHRIFDLDIPNNFAQVQSAEPLMVVN